MTQNIIVRETAEEKKIAEDEAIKTLSNIFGQSFSSTIPQRYLRRYAKVATGHASLGLSVKMKCYECVGFEDIDQRVGNCATKKCPLWNHRPKKA